MGNEPQTEPTGPGLTVYLAEGQTRQLQEITNKMGAPTMPGALKVVIERAYLQMVGKGPSLEERPLASLGQGEYRRDIMAEDV